MSGKRDLKRENELRREAAKRRRVERVLISYVKVIHPGIYDEAHMYYSSLVAKYHDKKDLTKTPEFQSFIKNKGPKMDNFELRIELIEQGTIPETPAPAAETTPAPAAETTSAPAAETTADPAAETTSAPAAETTSAPAAETTAALLPLDDDTLEQLIADLRQDPVILDFFDNIEYEIDNCPLW